MRPWGRFLLVCGLLLAAPGCLIWPAPTGDLLSGRGRITRAYAEPLQVGQATLEDVVLRLGEPDEIGEGGRLLIYRWTEVRGFLALVGMGGSGVLIPFPGHREVLVRFGAEGKVAEVAFRVPPEPEPAPGPEGEAP